MKAYVTSIGEPTRELCIWALQRNGFDTFSISGNESLAEKLKYIYDQVDDDFVRIDADVIVNKSFTPEMLGWVQAKNHDIWWWQFTLFDWFKLDIAHNTSFIKKEAIPALRANIEKFMHKNRPETEMSRIKEFYEPRRFETYQDEIIGLHGYKCDTESAKKLKHIRNQQDLYDFEMAERLNQL
ncbi:MAG: hypothetical protein EPO02_13440 [Nitrospirae bacterium]|nr:MAG: hypothetical protein EPO02_13440 [Nitrospirota bacterium]